MTESKRILVVEDDDSIRESVKDLLECENYAVDCANNGEEALQTLREECARTDLIVLDLMMPVMDGFRFRIEQKKDMSLAHIPVIIMTAGGHGDETRLSLDAKACLSKPMDIDVLLEVVKRCL